STFIGTVNSVNVTNTGTGTTIFQDDVTATNVNVNSGTSTFQDNLTATTTTITTGTGNFNTVSGTTSLNIAFTGDGVANLNRGLTGNVTTNSAGTGTLNLVGSNNQTVNGNVGVGNALKDVNSGVNGTTSTFIGTVNSVNVTNTGTGTTIFQDDVTATNVNVNSGTSTFQDKLTAGTTTITTGTGNFNTVSGTTSSNIVFSSTGTANLNNGLNGAINFAGNDGIVNVSDGKGISGTITTTTNNTGILNYLGDGTISSTVGSSGLGIKELNINTNDLQDTTTGVLASGNIYAGIIKLQNDGELTLANGVNIQDTDLSNPAITTTTTNTGTFTLQGASIISGDVGDTNYSLKEINSGITGTTSTFNDKVYAQTINNTGTNTTGISTFKDDVTATNVNVNSGTTNFEKNLIASTITIGTGIGNFNTVSGTTSSNIVFSSTGTANLNNGLTGNINFANYDATVNVSDGKGILGSVETLANNTGILNFKGDGVIDGIIGSVGLGIKELNINSENEQDSSDGVRVTYSALGREIYADTITLRNNAIFTLSDGVNLIDTGSDNIIVKVDTNDKGILIFEGTSTIDGEVGESNRVINTINAGATGETVTFNDMVYATNLKYSDNGKVILNGDNGSNVEGMKGTVDFGVATVSKPTLGNGKLEIGDNVNLTTGTSGIQFANANNAILTFNGTSTIYGVLGGNTAGNSTFESIYAGVTAETVTFKNDVYVKESTFHVSEDGVVNFEGNLYGDLVFENDGTVNVANTKSIIVSSTPLAITTANNGQGTINFEGTTTLYTDIGEDLFRLKEVNFGTVGTASNSYTQNINKDIYANDITIGNSSNKTTANLTSDMTFYGNLNLSSNSVLDVNNNDITVEDEIVLASNSTLKFEIDTSDLIAGQAVANDTSGSIDANSLNIQDDIKVHIDYNGTLAGKYEYSLIDANSSTGTYTEGTEANGKVSDNSIIDSKVILKDNNLVLVADRTNNGSFNPEDLYIEKSEIGEDYSNAASQALADYANGVDRAGALAQIINELEYLEGGTVLSEAKKQEMIETQRKLAPIANSSNMQTSITASNLAMTTIKGRLSDIRTGEMNNFTPTLYRTGLSSGDYYSFDTSFWLKGMAGKATQDQVDEYYGFDTSTYGFVGGMDKISGDGTIFGAALAYSTTKTNQENAASDSSDTTSIQGTIYSSLAYENAYVDSYLSYAKHKTDGTRTANSGKLTSSVDAEQISAKVETGYTIPVNDGVSLTPFASLEYSLLNQKGYTEKGTAYQNDALKVDSLKLNRGTVELGAKLTSNIELEETLIIPQLSVSAYNSFGDNSADIKAQYIGGGKEFVTPVSELNKTMYNVGLGLETKISDSTSVIFDMDYDRSKDGKFQGYSGSVTFGISF
ncbi:MAG: autotransporter domain-containing protein, partial [Arcobacter sp.]